MVPLTWRTSSAPRLSTRAVSGFSAVITTSQSLDVDWGCLSLGGLLQHSASQSLDVVWGCLALGGLLQLCLSLGGLLQLCLSLGGLLQHGLALGGLLQHCLALGGLLDSLQLSQPHRVLMLIEGASHLEDFFNTASHLEDFFSTASHLEDFLILCSYHNLTESWCWGCLALGGLLQHRGCRPGLFSRLSEDLPRVVAARQVGQRSVRLLPPSRLCQSSSIRLSEEMQCSSPQSRI